MKKTARKNELHNEELLEQAKKIMEKEGAKGWNLARKALLNQETRSSQIKEALNYVVQLPDFFRPGLAAICSEAAGGTLEVTVPSSASLIMLGKAIGIHDDIVDNLKKRKKRQTLFGKFGKEIALIVSDILLFKGFTLLRKNSEIGISQKTEMKILETIDKFWFEQAEGEIFELVSRRQTTTTTQECLAKIKMRASELETVARIGAILGGGSENEIEASGKYGGLLGTAAILRDELVDMLEFDVLKHRIKYESLPLPMIYALQNHYAKTKISQIISKKQFSNHDMLTISKITDHAGGISYVADCITKTVQEAYLHIKTFRNKRRELEVIANSLLVRPSDWKQIIKSM